MIVLDAQQLETLDQSRAAAFADRLAEFLRDNELLGPGPEDDPMRPVDEIVGMAHRFQLTRELSAARYAILASQFGLFFEALSNRPWYSQLRRGHDEATDPDWIDRVFTLVTTELESEGDK